MKLLHRAQVAAMNQHYQRFSLDYFLDVQQRLGLESIELWCGAQHFWLDDQTYGDVAALSRKLAARGLRAVSLTCPSFRYGYQYAPFSDAVYDRCLGYFQKGLEVAADLGCTVMTVNSGWGLLDRDPEESWRSSRALLTQLADRAEALGLVLAMETLRPDESNLVNSLSSARRMAAQVDRPALKLMVDTIAMGAAGECLEDWFSAFGQDLVHMHFLDGDPYAHYIWGDGNYPLEQMLLCLRQNGYTGYLVQEVADEGYFDDPAGADAKNIAVLSRFFD